MANISCYTSITAPPGMLHDGCNRTPRFVGGVAVFGPSGTYNRAYPPASNGAAGITALQSYGYQFNSPREVFAGNSLAVKMEDGYHPRILFATEVQVYSSERPDNRVQWSVSASYPSQGRMAMDVDDPVELQTIPGPATVIIQTLVEDGAGGFNVVWRPAFVES